MRRLWLKIFIVVTTANFLLFASLYFTVSWTFESSFYRHIAHQQEAHFDPLIEAITETYLAQGESWDWIHADDKTLWRDIMHEYVVQRRNDEGQRPPRRSDGSGADSQIAGINVRILLKDQAGEIVIGRNSPDRIIKWLPIEQQGQLIGQLGIPADNQLKKAFDEVMTSQAQARTGMTLVGLLLISSLLALALTWWATRRVFLLKRGTTALVKGEFDHRLNFKGKDAVAELGHDYDLLAKTLGKNRTAHQRWIADISHELRTPISILAGEIEALKDGIRQPSDAYFDGLTKDIQRLNLLINDLHQLSMSDMGALTYQKDMLDLAEVVEDELLKHSNHLPEGLASDWQMPNTPAYILGDEPRLIQLLSNLCSNSVRYTDAPGQIQVRVFAENRRWVLQWCDSSPSPENFEQLTNPLFRDEKSRSRKTAGSGLGLAISKAIVEAHAGTMQAKRSELGGLCWLISFPMYNEED